MAIGRDKRRTGSAPLRLLLMGLLAAASLFAGIGTASAAPARTGDTAAPQDVRPLVNSGSCRINIVTTSCKTSPIIRSNGVGHYVNYRITGNSLRASGEDWQVVDADNGRVVRSGDLGFQEGTSGRVPGLFGAYYVFVFNAAPGGGADIDNA
jgi:hypothetical protein